MTKILDDLCEILKVAHEIISKPYEEATKLAVWRGFLLTLGGFDPSEED